MNKETQNKIRSCKALQGKTIEDVCEMPEFLSNLEKYMQAQREDRKAIQSSYEAMRKLGGAKGYKLPSHPIDRVIDMSVEQFAGAYVDVIMKTSPRPAAERKYIEQLGQQAYNLTVAQIVCEEFPELHDEFFPKAN